MFTFATVAPDNFPKNQIDVHIPSNTSLTSISDSLANQNIISSPFLFKVFIVVFGGQKGLL
jgi:cell division protein YceG involved in septum cleavage